MSTSTKQIIVLLVDDDPDCRMLVRDAIDQTELGADVREACNGQDALAFLRRQGPFAHAPRPDVIYLDIEMPVMSGQEVLKAIKSDPRLQGIPVVMMTGLDDAEEKRAAARNGANSYILKSSHPSRFLETILGAVNYWLRIHQLPERGREEP